MRVGKVGAGKAVGYVPMQDRILSSMLASIRKAKAAGKSEHIMILRDQPATHKALDVLREHFDVAVKNSDAMKVTIKFR